MSSSTAPAGRARLQRLRDDVAVALHDLARAVAAAERSYCELAARGDACRAALARARAGQPGRP